MLWSAAGRGRVGTLLGPRAPWWPYRSAAVGQKCACVSTRSQVPSGAPLLGTKEAIGTHLTEPQRPALTLLSQRDCPRPGPGCSHSLSLTSLMWDPLPTSSCTHPPTPKLAEKEAVTSPSHIPATLETRPQTCSLCAPGFADSGEARQEETGLEAPGHTHSDSRLQQHVPCGGQ